jgi:ABC-type dipeptide/oligopeptide/nickel transport system permease subunit
MKLARIIAVALLALVAIGSVVAGSLGPGDYRTEFRQPPHAAPPNAAPSRAHWLGTDEVCRDRFVRLAYGTRVSLLLAPAAALLATLLAGLIGGLAGYLGGRWQQLAMAVTDLFLSMPWLFLLITVRALLPLNISPWTSVSVTFLLLGALGWAASARVVCAGAAAVRNSDFVLQARALGLPSGRLVLRHVLPHLQPVLLAQFCISIPVFILSEANLGVLGLGVTEPLPSWGSLLRELEDLTAFTGQWWKLAPLAALLIVVGAFEILMSKSEVTV